MTLTPIERFMSKVDMNGPSRLATRCWAWTGAKDRWGYGKFWLNDTLVKAHRFAFELHGGPIEAEELVLHACDNPACVNPGHLSTGTHADNAADCKSKGRTPLGRTIGRVPIEHRREMMTLVKSGIPLRTIADKFSVSIKTVRFWSRRASPQDKDHKLGSRSSFCKFCHT